MKSALSLFLLVLTTLTVVAQRPLTNSRKSSYYTYVYRLDATAIKLFYTLGPNKIDDKILHTPIDSFKTDHPRALQLPAGNYLKVNATENKLHYQLIERHTAFLKLLENTGDLSFVLLDSAGKEITDAGVYCRGRKITYDEDAHLYRASKSKKDTLFNVEYIGVSNFYKIEQYGYRANVNRKKQPFGKELWLAITSPLRDFFKKKPDNPYKPVKTNPGYIVFNKPKYRPGDTVKLKAFILTDRAYHPVNNKRLAVRLKTANDKGKTIGYVNAYTPGGFEYQFKLTDSLQLRLDSYCTISLEDVDNKFDPVKDAAKYQANRKVFLHGLFRYEDYELKTNKFTVRADKTEHSPGEPVGFYFRVTDDNGLDVPDGRVSVILKTNSITDFKGRHIFVPDTLWKHEMPLDPVGETKLIIPDSIFPKAGIGYNAQVVLLNSNNERHEEDRYLTYSNIATKIESKQVGDTLNISYNVLGKSKQVKATLYSVNDKNDTLSRSLINLPFKLKIDGAVEDYIVKADSLTQYIGNYRFDAMLHGRGNRTSDSLFIKVSNPLQLKFWYTIFDGDRILLKGNGTNLDYRQKFDSPHMVSVLLNYIWAGRAQSSEVQVPLMDKNLDITVKQPTVVYPGQQSDIDINVKDSKGHPVAGADLTAYALTAKFGEYNDPRIPYLGKEYPERKFTVPSFIAAFNQSGNMSLNWDRWSKQMGLDSIAYYKFTHPAERYEIEEPNPDSTTQIAPFVVKDGDIIPVHILYIDGIPVYFSKTDDMQRYSFKVKPGLHNLNFRTASLNIKLSDVEVKEKQKLILSLNADTLKNKQAKFIAMKDTLTDYEASLINNYLVGIVPNLGDNIAVVTQNDHLFLLNSANPNYYYSTTVYLTRRMPYNNHNAALLMGPVADNALSFTVKGYPTVYFRTEPGYSFQFEPGLIKQKSYAVKYPFGKSLANVPGITEYNQYAFTPKSIDTIVQNYQDQLSHNTNILVSNYASAIKNGQLIVSIGKQKDRSLPFVKSVIVYKYDDPDYVQIYAGSSTNLGYYEPGKYRVLYLLKGNTYFLQDSLIVKPYGRSYYSTGPIVPHAADSVSLKIAAVIDNYHPDIDNTRNIQQVKEIFNEKYLDATTMHGEMTGYVYDKTDKSTLPGVSIRVRGVQAGAVTDVNGFFRLKVPKSGKLVFTYIGYVSEEIPIHPGQQIKLFLDARTTALQEVVVTGYGAQKRSDLKISYRADTVEYRASDYKVRPNASLDELLKKMEGVEVGANGRLTHQGQVITKVRLNGKDYESSDIAQAIKNLPADVIESAQVIDDYGDQAARSGIKDRDPQKALNIKTGKILVITVNKDFALGLNDPGLLGMQSIRKNFSDYAYWQPKLKTDAQGNASFKATFPDDITNWYTYVVGMTGDKQSGVTSGQIRSYKPLSANFTAPLFAVRGDVLNPIGKVLNYTSDTVQLKRTFKLNGELFNEKEINLKNSLLDTFKVTANAKDSLTFEYSFKNANGYYDGEKRSIPLFEQGTLETKGTFAALERDTAITIQLDPKLKEGTFRAEASVLPALLDETEHLRNYEYLCNEQLASKLDGLLTEKKIRQYLGQPFKYDKDINDIIKKLQDNRRAQGTWGWWKDTDEELWISLHAATALLNAETQGYKTQLDKGKLVEYLLFQATAYHGEDKLTVMLLLRKLGAIRSDYGSFIKEYLKELDPKHPPLLYNKLRLMLVQQQNGQAFNPDSLFKYMHQTMFGNVYFGEESYNFFNNSMQESLLAYQLLKTEGKHPELLAKLRNYFLEQRKDGYWRNTYESAQIMEAILPDLLVEGKKPEPSVVTISGDKNATIAQFPYTTTLSSGASLIVKKTGTMPVYITAYQKSWNPQPEKVSKDFTVDTRFEKNGQMITKVKGGETIILKAEVNARADADYVMVEIPIPAGCTYLDKNQAYGNNEVHREYFKNKVSIFCRKLYAGKHVFTVTLTPRYGGTYHVNPAKAEMMYFPVFYGREGMKVFSIE